MNNLLLALLISLTLTVILEEVFAFMLKIRDRKNLLLITLINLLTNPPTVLVFYLIRQYTNISTLVTTFALEIMAILIEYVYIRHYGQKIRYPLWLAISMNAFSYSTGKVINMIFIYFI